MNEFDLKLKNALEAAFQSEWEELDNAVKESSYTFPEGFDDKVLDKAYKILNKKKCRSAETKKVRISNSNSKEYQSIRPRFRRAILVAIIAAVLMLGSLTAYAITHPEIIYNITRTVREWSFSFQQLDADEKTEFIPIKPEAPEGYEIVSEETYVGRYEIYYENNEGNAITFTQLEADGLGFKMDGEADINEIEINGHKGFCYRKYVEWILVWNNGYYILSLNGDCDYETLMNMAESIE